MTSKELERETRRTRIDPRLKRAGWSIIRRHEFDVSRPLAEYSGCAIEEYPTSNGPADYALVLNSAVWAVVEAKKVALDVQEDLRQAERYSKGLSENAFTFGPHHVPFAYASNGERVWFRDLRSKISRSRQTGGFHSPSALEELMERARAEELADLHALPNDHPWLRPYQRDANDATESAISNGSRLMLLAMATGTGKTFMSVNQVYRLLKTGVARRVLFLVDRRVLGAQAVQAFSSFEAEPGLKFHQVYELYTQRLQKDDLEEGATFDPTLLPEHYLTDPDPSHRFVYVSTIQRMSKNLFGTSMSTDDADGDDDEDAGMLDIPIHAFDLVIADECHRGYKASDLSLWRQTLDYFDAVRIGLTATPAAHTLDYFKEVPFRYEYERAVKEGYLVDYDVVSVDSNVRMNGMFLREGEAVVVVDTETGAQSTDVLEDERDFPASEIEQQITSDDSNRKILEEIRKYALAHEEEKGRFPKTLIFAVHDLPQTSHANALVDLARTIFGRGDDFVQKITGRSDRPLKRIREFRNRKEPGIVVSVDLMSTGVDIRDLEYIVLLRIIKSRILFEQVLGRGTRKGDRFPDKDRFTVFDCFGGTLVDYFRQATGITAEPPLDPAKTIRDVIEAIWRNEDVAFNTKSLTRRLRRIASQMSADARIQFSAFVDEGDIGRLADEVAGSLKADFTGTMKVLRDPAFLQLLENYPRASQPFMKALGEKDQVSSRWLIRGPEGKEYKPEDYLTVFQRFVAENTDRMDALGILLRAPSDWGFSALSELKEALTANQFSVAALQRAHSICYKKDLVDLISMVKHAASEEHPLLTAEQRVDAALERLSSGQTFSSEQAEWMARIRSHLIENLSVEQEDFEVIPIFARAGGWNPANRAFDGGLPGLLTTLNREIAA